jgi:hypothetical protein
MTFPTTDVKDGGVIQLPAPPQAVSASCSTASGRRDTAAHQGNKAAVLRGCRTGALARAETFRIPPDISPCIFMYSGFNPTRIDVIITR